jgi:hypothetical protein
MRTVRALLIRFESSMNAYPRPWLGRLASNGFWTSLAIAASVACGSAAETSAPEREDRASAFAGGPAPPEQRRPACAPDVRGLVPAAFAPIEIDCPFGYTNRTSFAALPVSGRFTTGAELRSAFCIELTGSDAPTTSPIAPNPEAPIDFEKSDVVAYAFDARSGVQPALFTRGEELWLRVTTTECSGEAPVLASVAFVVPKGKAINEQKCSLACR